MHDIFSEHLQLNFNLLLLLNIENKCFANMAEFNYYWNANTDVMCSAQFIQPSLTRFVWLA